MTFVSPQLGLEGGESERYEIRRGEKAADLAQQPVTRWFHYNQGS
jgi:hypothetical protein